MGQKAEKCVWGRWDIGGGSNGQMVLGMVGTWKGYVVAKRIQCHLGYH